MAQYRRFAPRMGRSFESDAVVLNGRKIDSASSWSGSCLFGVEILRQEGWVVFEVVAAAAVRWALKRNAWEDENLDRLSGDAVGYVQSRRQGIGR